MDVLQVYKDFFPPVTGGVERHLAEICRALAGHARVRVLVSSRGLSPTRERRDGIEILGAPELGRALSVPMNPTLPLWFRRLEADVWHVHSPNPMAELAWLLVRPRGALVVSYHSDVVRQARTFALYRPLYVKFLASARRILVSAPCLAATSATLAPFRDRCTVLPFGMDLERFRPSAAVETEVRAVRARHGHRLVLFVGRLIYFKGLRYLLDAMPYVDGRLLLIGDGPLRRSLEDQATRLGVAERVTFLGRLSDADLTAHLHACDLLVLPSSHASEGFGIVQLEAHACGKPTVCTEIGTGTSFANLHGITGLVVPPRDPQALAQAITRLLDDAPLRQKLGEAARRRVTTEFSLERLRSRLLEIYAEAVAAC